MLSQITLVIGQTDFFQLYILPQHTTHFSVVSSRAPDDGDNRAEHIWLFTAVAAKIVMQCLPAILLPMTAMQSHRPKRFNLYRDVWCASIPTVLSRAACSFVVFAPIPKTSRHLSPSLASVKQQSPVYCGLTRQHRLHRLRCSRPRPKCQRIPSHRSRRSY